MVEVVASASHCIAGLDLERAVSRSLIVGVDVKLEAAAGMVFGGGFHFAV